jgi:hypothetical protein
MKRAWIVAGAALGFVFTITMLSLITSVIWPGQAKLLAPLFCDDARPDAFVVSDTYSSAPGETSTSFTLYCVGPRGDHRDVGWFKPFLGICGMNALAVTAVAVAVGIRPWVRRMRRRQAAGEGMPGGVVPPRVTVPHDRLPSDRVPHDRVPSDAIPHDAVPPHDD